MVSVQPCVLKIHGAELLKWQGFMKMKPCHFYVIRVYLKGTKIRK